MQHGLGTVLNSSMEDERAPISHGGAWAASDGLHRRASTCVPATPGNMTMESCVSPEVGRRDGAAAGPQISQRAHLVQLKTAEGGRRCSR